MKLTGGGVLVIGGIAVIGAAIYYLWKHSDWFNPASQSNIANKGFNTLYQDLTGSKGTLGGDIYNILHPGQAPITGPVGPGVCFVYDSSGALVYINGVAQTAPCGTTTPQGQALTADQVRALRGGA